MSYIRHASDPGCFLCAMSRSDEDRANLILHRGRSVFVVMNRYPYNNGHLMVTPYRHVADMEALSAEERAETMDVLATSIQALRRAIRPDGFNVGINLGRAGGAGLDSHIHTHIVPRWNGDTNFMPVLADVKVIPQALGELWDLLRPLF